MSRWSPWSVRLAAETGQGYPVLTWLNSKNDKYPGFRMMLLKSHRPEFFFWGVIVMATGFWVSVLFAMLRI
jgi:hypothetical protein